MEHEDWTMVIVDRERRHFTDQEAVARAFSVALLGDDKDWHGHMTHAKEFIEEMKRTFKMPEMAAHQ